MDKCVKVCIATSTRADWGLLQPLALALKARPDVSVQILATNMHLLPRYGHTVDEIKAAGFSIDAEVRMPDTDDRPRSKVSAMANCMEGCADAFEKLSPDLLVILGDRYEMLAIAATATLMNIPVAHIAGGEISEGAIDDSIRHAITKLSALHFTETEEYRQRVLEMGEQPANVVNAGSLGVWNIMHQPLLDCGALSQRIGFPIGNRDTLLVTYHPATLDEADPGIQADTLMQALDKFPEYKVLITYPNNDAGSEQIIKVIHTYADRNPGRVKVIKSLGMTGYLSMLRYAAAVIGNSSSGIIEVPSTGVATVDIGSRQRGRQSGPSVIHCGESQEEITAAITKALSPDFAKIASARINPYSKPDTVEVIVEKIMNTDLKKILNKKFYDTIIHHPGTRGKQRHSEEKC